jgi:hypothetical protein
MFRLQHKYIQALKRADLQERTTILDVPTRWNSTHDMVQRFCALKKAIIKALNDVGDFTNTVGGDTWRLCEELSRFLQPFALVSTLLTASKHMTSSLVIPSLHVISKTLFPVVNVGDDQRNDSQNKYQTACALWKPSKNTLQGTYKPTQFMQLRHYSIRNTATTLMNQF